MGDGVSYRKQAAKWYKSPQWRRLRAAQLSAHPLCQCPHHNGADGTAVADVVDHITPHRGNKVSFFDRRNLQSMTKHCHDKYKQSLERGGKGFDAGSDEYGNPTHGGATWWR